MEGGGWGSPTPTLGDDSGVTLGGDTGTQAALSVFFNES